jgi:small-conductance mechanosensitive channel
MNFPELLQTEFFGNTLQAWVYAVMVLLLTAIGLRLLLRSLVVHLAALAERSATQIDDLAVSMLSQVRWWVLLILGVYAASRFLVIPESTSDWLQIVAGVVVLLQLGLWLNSFVGHWISRTRQRRMADSPGAATGLFAVGLVARMLVWSVITLLILDNMGVNVTTLVASLGIGGVAVALAVQNILGDLFASFSIVFDKPFEVGDFLIIDTYMGVVERVGMKTTRLRSLTGEQLVISNSDLLSSRVRNYGRMQERRINFEIGVTYDTPRDKLKLIPHILKNAIEQQPKTRFDRAHFKSYGDFSLIFETVYYVSVPDYNTYMDIQQNINLDIHEQFEHEQIEFAFPTQTIYLQQQ